MPTLIGQPIRDRIAQLDWTPDRVYRETGIPDGTMRNITRDRDPDVTSWRRAYRLARVLDLPISEIVAGNEGVPDEPPEQPKGPKGPPKRQDKEKDGDKDRTRPKREQRGAVA